MEKVFISPPPSKLLFNRIPHVGPVTKKNIMFLETEW